ncbi:uncharacterized protein LOC124852425 isoform X2 [Hippoglossus stenolepis]|uniref:uncharacterized protein LOC124852425 isoform X2 n=1 Tax=Hippoglossus stenolepis TaxID=195615 RepID=UPI001FAF7B3C|nr:uncharacterized protein LOC124852425 isoform X2 [Hippoglossus stenolepis]
MDFKVREVLRHCVLVYMILELQWRPVFSAPAHNDCNDLNNTKLLSKLLLHQAKDLLNHYIKFHGPRSNSSTDDVPDSTVSGVNVFEKLQDVYVKNRLFQWHILNVAQHHLQLWGNKEPVAGHLSRVKGRLSHHLSKVKLLLTDFFPDMPLPPTPAPPNSPTGHTYAKKEYGWLVIVRLRDWEKHVLQLLEEMDSMCVQQKVKRSHHTFYSLL